MNLKLLCLKYFFFVDKRKNENINSKCIFSQFQISRIDVPEDESLLSLIWALNLRKCYSELQRDISYEGMTCCDWRDVTSRRLKGNFLFWKGLGSHHFSTLKDANKMICRLVRIRKSQNENIIVLMATWEKSSRNNSFQGL